MKSAAIGRLRQRLIAEEPVETRDDTGGASLLYVGRVSLWAEIETLGTVPQFEAARPESMGTHRIQLRATNVVAAGWRLRKGARIFEILAIARDETAIGRIACRCREIA